MVQKHSIFTYDRGHEGGQIWQNRVSNFSESFLSLKMYISD
jgi:hypothetical protein